MNSAVALTVRRLCAYRRAAPPLRDCWRQLPSVWQATGQHGRYLAVDIETTALSPADGEIVSVGWVAIDGGDIELASAAHYLLGAEGPVGDSAVFHQLRDCDREAGESAERVLARLLAAAAGRVLIFHCAELDLAFLNALCRRHLGAPLLLPFIDTLQLEYRRRQRRQQPILRGALGLAACREHYRLPNYPAHNALSDALATAELFLAISAH